MADLGKIEGKTFLITGAASGLGAGYVESFLKEGAKSIAIVDIAENKGKELAENLNKSYPGKVVFVKCDVSSEDDIQAAFSEVVTKFGTLDVVINNAGILNDSPQTWRKQCEVNYAGLVSFSLKAIKHMSISEGGKGGTIVNISSALGLLRFPFLPIYSATKAAVLHFSVSIAMDPFYERTGVRVLTMCFGATDTPLLEKLHITGYDEFNSEMMGMSPETSGPFQKPESAVKGVVDMFKRGSNGSVWLSIYNNEVVEITSDISNAFEILDKKYKLT